MTRRPGRRPPPVVHEYLDPGVRRARRAARLARAAWYLLGILTGAAGAAALLH